MRVLKSMVAGCVALVAGSAIAQPILTASIAVDNVFNAYISQDQNTQGTLFLSGFNWQQTYSGSVALETGGTYYIHIEAVDQGPPAMFIGQFSLSNTDASFINGTQGLLTNVADWQCNTTGWASAFGAPTDVGGNAGGATWGTRPDISLDARYLWNAAGSSTTYFTTSIRVIPAPGAGLAMIGGLVIAGRRRR